MANSQAPRRLANVVAGKMYNAQWFSGTTKEAQIQSAITSAATDGALYVFVPANMLPYNASLVIFNVNVRMIAEGYDPSEWNVRAYGAAGDAIQNDQAAIVAANAGAQTSTIFGGLVGGIVKFPVGKYAHTATLQQLIAGGPGLAGSVIWRGDGERCTYLFPSGPSTNFLVAPLFNACF